MYFNSNGSSFIFHVQVHVYIYVNSQLYLKEGAAAALKSYDINIVAKNSYFPIMKIQACVRFRKLWNQLE